MLCMIMMYSGIFFLLLKNSAVLLIGKSNVEKQLITESKKAVAYKSKKNELGETF